jgi:putative protease
VYRKAIDDAAAGRPFDERLLGALESLANRGYTDGFYQRHHTADHQNYLQNVSTHYQQQFVGEITGYDARRQLAHVLVKNRFAVGDSLELILPEGNHTFTLQHMEDEHGAAMQVAPGSDYRVLIPVPATELDKGLLARNLKAERRDTPAFNVAISAR